MKKTVLLAGLSLLTAASAAAYSFEAVNDENVTIYYDINADGTTVSVTYKDTDYKSYSGAVNIPATVTHGDAIYQVTNIGESAFYNCPSLTSVTFPSSLISIGDEAFHYCSGLYKVDIPDSVTEIGAKAFKECTSLTDLTLSTGLTEIGDYAFYYCQHLTDLSVPANVSKIGEDAFSSCDLLSIYIPSSVTTIGSFAFSHNGNLAEVTVDNEEPATITLGNNVFNYCPVSDATLYVPQGALSKYEEAGQWKDFGTMKAYVPMSCDFAVLNSDGVTIYYTYNEDGTTVSVASRDNMNPSYSGDVNIPSYVTYKGVSYNVTAIGGYAFASCVDLASVTIPEGVTFIGNQAFYFCKALTQVTLPSTVTLMANDAFSGCTALATVNLSANLQEIPKNTFKNCSSLSGIVIPESVSAIGSNAFVNCTSLTEIVFPEGVKTIGSNAFTGCTALTDVTIPATTTAIWGEAFSDCTALDQVVLYVANPSSMYTADDTFANVDLSKCTLYVPEGSLAAYNEVEPWKSFGTKYEFKNSGISDIVTEGPAADAVYYDLSGRLVARPTRGLYILNGRKVLVK